MEVCEAKPFWPLGDGQGLNSNTWIDRRRSEVEMKRIQTDKRGADFTRRLTRDGEMFCLEVRLSLLSGCMSVWRSVWRFCRSVWRSVCLEICLSGDLSVCLDLEIFLGIFLENCLSGDVAWDAGMFVDAFCIVMHYAWCIQQRESPPRHKMEDIAVLMHVWRG